MGLFGGIIDTVADVFGVGSNSAKKNAISDANRRSNAGYSDALKSYQTEYKNQLKYMQPYRVAGINALNDIKGGEYDVPEKFSFTAKDLYFDPSYSFRLSEGQKALERSAAARGGLLSGRTLKAIQGYGQNMASQEFQNAYDRAVKTYGTNLERSNTGYNRLFDLAKMGGTAAANSASYSGNYGANKAATQISKATNNANALIDRGTVTAAQRGQLFDTIGDFGTGFSNSLQPKKINWNQTSPVNPLF